LYLYNNKLEGEIPKEIGKLTNLHDLCLNNNKLEEEIPKEIQELNCDKKI
jgi:Leucine-rich repeat (LRR) protein